MRTASINLNDRAAYGIPEASHYLRMSYSTLRSWTSGTGIIQAPEYGFLSFNNLLEAYMLKALRRKHRFSMQSIRRALSDVSRLTRSERPLLDSSFATDGISLFLEHEEDLVNLTRRGQLAIKEIVSLYMTRIERDSAGVPIRLFPFVVAAQQEEPKSISINPRVAFGRSVLAGTAISTEVVAGRFAARDSVPSLAEEYGVSPSIIEDAIRWESPLMKAA
jgi:uncharacterized protein (DUF433 family)